MRWVLDGYNLIRRDPDLRGREAEGLAAGRAALLALVARAARRSSDTFTVVFDGERRSAAAESSGRVQVVFSRPPESADDVLRRLAGELREAAVVVTSDRVVQTAARRAGAVAVSAEAFLRAVEPATESADEVLDQDEEDDDDQTWPRRGPGRRPARAARAAARVLQRLRPRS